jgi:hypothetical protein
MRGRLVSEGLSLSALSLAGDGRQLPCGDDSKKYVVHLDSGFAIHCIASRIFAAAVLKNSLRDHVQSRDLIGYLGSRIRTKTRILSIISSTQLIVSRASSQPTFS